MASKAERARSRRARTVARALEAPLPASPAAPLQRGVISRGTERRGRDDGLDMLRERGRIGSAQYLAGRTYGMLWRTAQIADGTPIAAVDLDAVRGGGGGPAPQSANDNTAWIADSRARLWRAHLALHDHEAMVATLGLICGAGMRPREISPVQRESEQIETALRLALDILVEHFKREPLARFN
jgi:hypothetical protein